MQRLKEDPNEESVAGVAAGFFRMVEGHDEGHRRCYSRSDTRRSWRSRVIDKAIMGAHAPTGQSESFNLDAIAIVNGQHVFLACDDPKGCEAPALGTYDGELKRGKWIRMTFTIPVTNKSVSRWYKIGGSW